MRAGNLPIIRLDDGKHVTAFDSSDQSQAFLPSLIETNFPTVRRAVCNTEAAHEFLLSLGLTEPDPVDDVVRNVLPKYAADEVDVDEARYEADIGRILTAFKADSKIQQEKLTTALRQSAFVMAKDAGDGTLGFAKPGDVYLATERLKSLFEGVTEVFLVDDTQACLRGEDIRDLLEACGSTRYLKPQEHSDISWDKLKQLRERAGSTGTQSQEHIKDYSLHGLEALLYELPSLNWEQRHNKASLLWEALSNLEQRQKQVFTGTYRGRYYNQRKTCDFDPSFIEILQNTAWVPDADSKLQQPEFVVFDTLGWTTNPFLLSKIEFKPPLIETLAREAGIEPGVLDLLKRLGVTSEAELNARLGIKDEPEQPQDEPDPATSAGQGGRAGASDGTSDEGGTRRGTGGGGSAGGRSADSRSAGNQQQGGTGTRPFISYVGVNPTDEEPDPDGLDQQARMALEEAAIRFILNTEPELKRTPPNNPGFDLFESDAEGKPVRWVEVKAMRGSLNDRPVGLSRPQFLESARDHRTAYWLYVVENAGDDQRARILRIRDPFGKARTFTFDRGWVNAAEVDDETD